MIDLIDSLLIIVGIMDSKNNKGSIDRQSININLH